METNRIRQIFICQNQWFGIFGFQCVDAYYSFKHHSHHCSDPENTFTAKLVFAAPPYIPAQPDDTKTEVGKLNANLTEAKDIVNQKSVMLEVSETGGQLIKVLDTIAEAIGDVCTDSHAL